MNIFIDIVVKKKGICSFLMYIFIIYVMLWYDILKWLFLIFNMRYDSLVEECRSFILEN